MKTKKITIALVILLCLTSLYSCAPKDMNQVSLDFFPEFGTDL